jgi:hypothetical protein
MWDGEKMCLMLGPLPDPIEESDYIDWVDDHFGPIDEDDNGLRHPVVGVVDYDDIWVSGAIFLVTVEVHPKWRRGGTASLMIDGLRALYPGLPILADRADGNTAAGNAFIDGYNRAKGAEVIRRLGRHDRTDVTGYQPTPDEFWPALTRASLPRR